MMPTTFDPSAFLYIQMLSVRLTQAHAAFQMLQTGRFDGTEPAKLMDILTELRQLQYVVHQHAAPLAATTRHRAADAFLWELVAVGEAVFADTPNYAQTCADLAEDNTIFQVELQRFAQVT